MKIWTNGCFDILHRGHIELFKYAKSLGGELYVGIDSDYKVNKDKGPDRPFFSEDDRRCLVNSIKYVDSTYIFGSTYELEQLIKRISPDIMVIGSDWKGKTVIGEQYAKKLEFFDRIERYSTTEIIEGRYNH
jgi:rfaE bifunctional protein nucleotidyltransferase chain/domain|tara:strand:+ start:2089 stop:2484 length:396 start_codon:yes stop_codon:yes gene_type:complete